jgi:membrane-associated phospholipid phosphatase
MDQRTTGTEREGGRPRIERSGGWPAAVLLLALAAVLALPLDVPLARWLSEGPELWGLDQVCRLAEVFGHGLGVLMLVGVLWVLDPARRWAVPRLLVMSLGAGLVANGLKLLVGRYRPHRFDFAGGVWDSFTQWLPLLGEGSGQQSFPSAHAATAMGFAVGLSCLYPRGRALFCVLAGLVGVQRLLSQSHFLSDALVGLAAGCLFALGAVGTCRLAWLCNVSEDWLASLGPRWSKWLLARHGRAQQRALDRGAGTPGH